MKISIIIPVYNAEKYIEKCISYIEKQTYDDYEIILINDGSKDNSGLLCDTFACKNDKIKVIHQENSGPGPSRNAGIKIATGDYILFVDSDDYIVVNTLETLAKAAKNNNFPDVVIFDYIMGNERCRFNRSTISGEKEGFVNVRNAILNSTGATWCKMYKSTIVKNNFINFPSMKRKEDFVFNKIALSYCKNVFYVKENLYYYFNNANSIMHTTTFSDEIQKIAFQTLEKFVSLEYKDVIDVLRINNYFIGKVRNICENERGIKVLRDFIRNYEFSFPNWYEKSKELKLSKESKLYLYLINRKYFYSLKSLSIIRMKIKKYF